MTLLTLNCLDWKTTVGCDLYKPFKYSDTYLFTYVIKYSESKWYKDLIYISRMSDIGYILSWNKKYNIRSMFL